MPCDDCHMETGFSEVSRANALKLHARTRMPLRASHERLDCRKCHQKRRRLGAARTFEARLRLFAGLQADCGSCHKEPHDGRLGKDCAACHAETKFTDTDDALVRKVHSKTGFSLRGKHRRVKCSGCHAPSGDFQHRFRATQGKRCTDCHYDPHGAFKSVKGGDACETCHSVNGFAPASFDLDSHAQTRFALRFAHRVVPCSKCHPQTDREDNPRLQIAQLIGIDSRCLGCHGQPHDRQFETREPALECWVCHRETNFADLTFDHQQSRFPLQGAHRQARCDQCHVRPPTTAKTPAAVRFTGTPTRCEQCHVDPHRGQFVRNGPARKCEDCHTIRSKFVIPRFAHDKTRFALEGKHAQVGCDKCHRKVDVAGQQAVLYRMGPTPCEHCHENPHERGAP